MRVWRTRTLMRLTGTVSSGLGRAHVFMAQEHYQTQFKSILENEAWPGTLNVRVAGEDLAAYVALRNLSGVDTLDIDDEIRSNASMIDISEINPFRVRGFLREGRSFGGATAFHATICSNEQELACAILIPDLTRHVDVVEVIAIEFLRGTLGIADGDVVSLNLD
jgi:riboflavin kinase